MLDTAIEEIRNLIDLSISYQPLKRKHTNYNLFSTNFDILKEMDLKYALGKSEELTFRFNHIDFEF